MNQQGFTLLEVMLSLFFVSIAILFVEAANLHVMKKMKMQYRQEVALMLLKDIVRVAQAKKQLSSKFIKSTQLRAATLLPSGRVAVSADSGQHFTVSISWGIRSDTCIDQTIIKNSCIGILIDV